MTNQCWRMVVLAAALVAMTPQSADAGLLSWLSRLSGPGPFWGLDAEICMKTFTAEREGTKPPDFHTESVGGGALRLSCPGAKLDKRHVSWHLNVGAALAWKNPLDYSGVDVTDRSKRVWLLKLGTSFDFTVAPSVDVGVGGGIFYFGGERFDGFTRPYIEPLRLAVRPLLLARGRNKDETEHDGWLAISGSWIIHLGTLDGPSFGAPLSTFRSYNEHNVGLGLTVDVIRLLK